MKTPLIFALVLAGCGIVDPCKDRERNFDLLYANNDALQRDMATMHGMVQDGWTCQENGKILNAFGTEIGSRFRCTVCN